jgi:hypothetical protein
VLTKSTEPNLFDVLDDETSQIGSDSAGAPQLKSQLSESVLRSDSYRATVSAHECEPGTANEFHIALTHPSFSAEQESTDPLPQWRVMQLSQIEIHPLLPQLYVQRGIRFPPEWPEFLTARGIRQTSRFLPVHVVVSERKLLCFAGVRLWLAAMNCLPHDSELEVLLYSTINEAQLCEGIEIEQDILYVWHRQSVRERQALEMSYVNSASANGLRLNFDGKEQQRWQKILKISLKTLQNRLASRRRKA